MIYGCFLAQGTLALANTPTMEPTVRITGQSWEDAFEPRGELADPGGYQLGINNHGAITITHHSYFDKTLEEFHKMQPFLEMEHIKTKYRVLAALTRRSVAALFSEEFQKNIVDLSEAAGSHEAMIKELYFEKLSDAVLAAVALVGLRFADDEKKELNGNITLDFLEDRFKVASITSKGLNTKPTHMHFKHFAQGQQDGFTTLKKLVEWVLEVAQSDGEERELEGGRVIELASDKTIVLSPSPKGEFIAADLTIYQEILEPWRTSGFLGEDGLVIGKDFSVLDKINTKVNSFVDINLLEANQFVEERFAKQEVKAEGKKVLFLPENAEKRMIHAPI